MEIGERISNLERMILLREGVTRSDDDLPPRMKQPVPNGPTEGHLISDEMLDVMLNDYYSLRGWDVAGVPTPQTLERLGLLELTALV